MAGLGKFKPTSHEIEVPGGSFTVRALAFEDFTILIQTHYAPMAALFDRYIGEASLVAMDKATGGALDLVDMRSVVLEALETAPALLGDLIARASDEPDLAYLARTLPLGVQIEAVGRIVALTLEAEGGMEKLMGTINMLTATLSSAVTNRSR